MKLELKHLAPYLPYKVYGYTVNNRRVLLTHKNISYVEKLELRPLSDLTKEDIKAMGFKLWELDIEWIKNQGTNETPYGIIEYLLSKHYDVFGLIPAGLAIDINTLNYGN